MSIWNTLHQQVTGDIDVLSQYDSISIYEKSIEALNIGLEYVHGMLSNIDMKPKGDI